MERNIEMEGILAMLEEIKGNTEKPQIPGEAMGKLLNINEIYTSLATKPLVTEKFLARCLISTIEQIEKHNGTQNEEVAKLKNYILEYHKYVKEQVTIQQENINARLERIENLLREQQAKQGILERFEQWIKSI